MSEVAKLRLGNREIDLPVVVGTENEPAIDISKLRSQTGYITLDEGYVNTGSTTSAITYLDGEQGILRYRGYPIEMLAEKCDFVEVCHLLIYGELPNATQLDALRDSLRKHTHDPRGDARVLQRLSARCASDGHLQFGRRSAVDFLPGFAQSARSRSKSKSPCTACWPSCRRSLRTRTKNRSDSRSCIPRTSCRTAKTSCT